MSSFLIGAGRTYSLDLDFGKSPSTSSRASHASSPSSTLSESSNCPLTISTRKPRTPRKRPNQTYNEAAALLSTAYPTIFPAKNLTKQHKFTSPQDSFFDESTELLFPFRVTDNDYSGFLLQNHIQEKPNFRIEPIKIGNSSGGEVNSGVSCSANICSKLDEDFYAESILDEEIEEGIDSIMGNLSVDSDKLDASNGGAAWDGNPIGLGFGGKIEFPLRGVRAWRHSDEGNWWNSPTVNVHQISPKITSPNKKVEKKKKKKKVVEIKDPEVPRGNPSPDPKPKPKPKNGLLLKLNFDAVLNAWSDRGCPFHDADLPPGSDVSARVAEIDLFCENGGGVREARVLRFKEKRRTRLFSKKIRYQVRKVNADIRPRMKGRFVRYPNSSGS